MANIVSPLFGGLPATGAIARTATNIRSGARTPVAGMIHALTMLLILVALAPLAATIPMAVLAGLLMIVVSANMGEWHEIPQILRQTRADVAVWLDHVRADGVRRPDGGRRSGHDSGGAPLHPARLGNDDRVTRDAGVHRAKGARTACRTR